MAKTPTENSKKVLKLTPKEQEYLTELRVIDEKKRNIAAEIDKILAEGGATLVIDPQSPFGSPAIKVELIRK